MNLPVTPDIAGFIAAQDRLRDLFSEEVVFHIPEDATYAPDVKLDPQTHKPYDPTMKPTSGGGFTDVPKNVSVIYRPITGTLQDDAEGEFVAGLRKSTRVVLDCLPPDWSSVEEATEATVKGERYRITDAVEDGVVSIDRVLVFLESL